MKPLLMLQVLALCHSGWAHRHIEVGVDPANAGRLILVGAPRGQALFVPAGEPFSSYAPQFPGDGYPDELTFSSEGQASEFPEGSLPSVELLSVTGPEGAVLSFFEVNATTATWSKPTGWDTTTSAAPSIAVSEDGAGFGHIHGRIFSVNRPGLYSLSFRAVDSAGVRQPSLPFTYNLEALPTPPLALSLAGPDLRIRFTSRSFTSYDLQTSEDLRNWSTHPEHQFIAGTGDQLELKTPVPPPGRALFVRIVEFF